MEKQRRFFGWKALNSDEFTSCRTLLVMPISWLTTSAISLADTSRDRSPSINREYTDGTLGKVCRLDISCFKAESSSMTRRLKARATVARSAPASHGLTRY